MTQGRVLAMPVAVTTRAGPHMHAQHSHPTVTVLDVLSVVKIQEPVSPGLVRRAEFSLCMSV